MASGGSSACLVTGGAGFIGCNLADRLLHKGRPVVLLDNFSRPGSRLNSDWLQQRDDGGLLTVREGDVRDADLMQSVVADAGTVFHLAAQTAVTTSIADPRADFDTNVLGTVNVLEAARSCSPPPVVLYSSTNKVYGDLEDQVILEEDTRYVMPELPHGVPETATLAFTSPYACSKGAADQYMLTYAETYGVPAVVLRQSCIYGPRQMGVEDQGWTAWFLLAGALGIRGTIYGDGKQVRDLLYIDDLVDAFLAAVEAISRTAGHAYNVGGGPEFSLSIWHEFAPLAAELDYRLPEVSFAEARQGDQRVFVSDNRRATADFGWSPTVSPAVGIARLAEWVDVAAPSLRPLLGA
jgi:CDP-paratose 2-epimerase